MGALRSLVTVFRRLVPVQISLNRTERSCCLFSVLCCFLVSLFPLSLEMGFINGSLLVGD